MHPWLTTWGNVIPPEELQLTQACELRDYLVKQKCGIADILNTYRSKDGHELLVIKIKTSVPQVPKYKIKQEEVIAILISIKPSYPIILVLRDDFPDTPHQNWMPEGYPYCLCIDNRPWEDVQSNFTAHELIKRILDWFQKAGKGRLHDTGQFLDPFFFTSNYHFILPKYLLTRKFSDIIDLIGYIPSDGESNVVKFCSKELANNISSKDKQRIFFLAVDFPDVEMSRLRKAPSTLQSLLTTLEPYQLDITKKLQELVNYAVSQKNSGDASLIYSWLGILIKIPITCSSTEKKDIQRITFLIQSDIGKIGIGLGMLLPNNLSDNRGHDYVSNILTTGKDINVLKDINIVMVNNHSEFDINEATYLAGRNNTDLDKIVIIGAGTVGSLVSEILCREGRNICVLIDNDILLPHNLERHTLNSENVGQIKSKAVANRLNSIRKDSNTVGIEQKFQMHASDARVDDSIISMAEIVIDASASVSVARSLCDHENVKRIASIFFNPAGNSCVLMVEDASRKSDLRSIEALYYQTISTDSKLENHLSQSVETVQYGGQCRSLTNRIPCSRAHLLSSLLASGLSKALDRPDANLTIWTVDDLGSVSVLSNIPQAPKKEEQNGWTIYMDKNVMNAIQKMRSEKLNNETGGVLLGVVDRTIKRIDLVKALPAPTDSKETEIEFFRGTKNLLKTIKKEREKTLDQVEYVGEWHSHPRGCSTERSSIDMALIKYLKQELADEGLPGLIVIAGDNEIKIYVSAEQPDA